jgi:hypothetical protein
MRIDRPPELRSMPILNVGLYEQRDISYAQEYSSLQVGTVYVPSRFHSQILKIRHKCIL